VPVRFAAALALLALPASAPAEHRDGHVPPGQAKKAATVTVAEADAPSAVAARVAEAETAPSSPDAGSGTQPGAGASRGSDKGAASRGSDKGAASRGSDKGAARSGASPGSGQGGRGSGNGASARSRGHRGGPPPGQAGRAPATPQPSEPAPAPGEGAVAGAAAAGGIPPLAPIPAGSPVPSAAPDDSPAERRRRVPTRTPATPTPAPGTVAAADGAVPPALAPATPGVEIEPTRRARRGAERGEPRSEDGFVVTRTIRDLIGVVPDWVWFALAALGGLALLLGAGIVLTALRARRLDRQRRKLLEDVGLLEAAVVPDVPKRVGGVWTSVAFRAADGPAAGGDFYDVFPLEGGRTGVVVGDVMGHGGDALARTTLLRHTLRAYLEAELSPREAIRTADRVLTEQLEDSIATVVVALHDERAGTLTYACAGHPPPVLLGRAQHIPVTEGADAPLGAGARTGLRQTTVSFAGASLACFYTDGLSEARIDGGLLGYERLAEVIADLGPGATARNVLDAVADAAEHVPDDMAVCVLRPAGSLQRPRLRIEEVELTAAEVDGGAVPRFVRACGLGEFSVERADSLARRTVHKFGGTAGVVVRVRLSGFRPGVDILPARGEEPHPAAAPVLAGTRV